MILEDTSAAIWHLLDGHRTEREISAELAHHYEAPFEAVAHDVAVFLERLRGLGLLDETVDGPEDER